MSTRPEFEYIEVGHGGQLPVPPNPVYSYSNNNECVTNSEAFYGRFPRDTSSLPSLEDPTRNKSSSISESDSDVSIEIIEVPKRDVPVIYISDSDIENEANKDAIKAKSIHQQQHYDRKKMSVREKLEEYKVKIFPIKKEAVEGRMTPEDKHDSTCSICLGFYDNRAFLDACFHSFCYTCILQWANVVQTCPLCKSSFKSIIYDIKPDLQYQQHFLDKKQSSKDEANLTPMNFAMNSGRRFHYRSTSIPGNGHWRDIERQSSYNARNQTRQRQLTSWGQQRSRWGHSAATHDRRRMIYRLGMVIKEVKHHGRIRYRDISLQFMRNNPAVTHRFVPWILRDLSVLLENNTGHVSFVLHLIISLLARVSMESQEFHDQLQPFLSNNTSQFISELVSFASSPYDMGAYDDKVVYEMPSAMPVNATSASNPDVFMNPEPSLMENRITLEERLLDETFAGEGHDTSPPLANHCESSSDESTLINVDWNSDDSELKITKVVHVQPGLSSKPERSSDKNKKHSSARTSKNTPENHIISQKKPNRKFDIHVAGSTSSASNFANYAKQSRYRKYHPKCEKASGNSVKSCPVTSEAEVVSPSFPVVRSSISSYNIGNSSMSNSSSSSSRNSSSWQSPESKSSRRNFHSQNYSSTQSHSNYSSGRSRSRSPRHTTGSKARKESNHHSSSSSSFLNRTRNSRHKDIHGKRPRSNDRKSSYTSGQHVSSRRTHKYHKDASREKCIDSKKTSQIIQGINVSGRPGSSEVLQGSSEYADSKWKRKNKNRQKHKKKHHSKRENDRKYDHGTRLKSVVTRVSHENKLDEIPCDIKVPPLSDLQKYSKCETRSRDISVMDDEGNSIHCISRKANDLDGSLSYNNRQKGVPSKTICKNSTGNYPTTLETESRNHSCSPCDLVESDACRKIKQFSSDAHLSSVKEQKSFEQSSKKNILNDSCPLSAPIGGLADRSATSDDKNAPSGIKNNIEENKAVSPMGATVPDLLLDVQSADWIRSSSRIRFLSIDGCELDKERCYCRNANSSSTSPLEKSPLNVNVLEEHVQALDQGSNLHEVTIIEQEGDQVVLGGSVSSSMSYDAAKDENLFGDTSVRQTEGNILLEGNRSSKRKVKIISKSKKT